MEDIFKLKLDRLAREFFKFNLDNDLGLAKFDYFAAVLIFTQVNLL